MNRAMRRGNPVRSRWSGATGVRLITAAQERSGVEHDTGKHAPESAPRPVKEANERARTASGRFERGQKPESLPILAPAPLSRQQRRYQARVAEKVARAWSEVTKGGGVTLLDGQEVAVKGGD